MAAGTSTPSSALPSSEGALFYKVHVSTGSTSAELPVSSCASQASEAASRVGEEVWCDPEGFPDQKGRFLFEEVSRSGDDVIRHLKCLECDATAEIDMNGTAINRRGRHTHPAVEEVVVQSEELPNEQDPADMEPEEVDCGGETKYSCPVKNCDRMFSRRAPAFKHIREFHGAPRRRSRSKKASVMVTVTQSSLEKYMSKDGAAVSECPKKRILASQGTMRSDHVDQEGKFGVGNVGKAVSPVDETVAAERLSGTVNANVRANCAGPGRRLHQRVLTKCPECGAQERTWDKVREHMITAHSFPLVCLEFRFADMKAFETWKKQVEKEEIANFVITTKNNSRISYKCHRSVAASSDRTATTTNANTTGQRRSSKVTHKLDVFCPAGIDLYLKGGLYARFWKTHYGHTPDPRFLRLPEETRDLIRTRLSEGVAAEDIIDEILKSYNGEDLSRAHFISVNDIYNVAHRFSLKVIRRTSDKHQGRSIELNSAADLRRRAQKMALARLQSANGAQAAGFAARRNRPAEPVFSRFTTNVNHGRARDAHVVATFPDLGEFEVEYCGRREHVAARSAAPHEDCDKKCAKCDVCVHRYWCTCVSNTVDGQMCVHIHAVCAAAGRPSRQLVDTDAEPDNDSADATLSPQEAMEVLGKLNYVDKRTEVIGGVIRLQGLAETRYCRKIGEVLRHIDAATKLLEDSAPMKPSLSTNKRALFEQGGMTREGRKLKNYDEWGNLRFSHSSNSTASSLAASRIRSGTRQLSHTAESDSGQLVCSGDGSAVRLQLTNLDRDNSNKKKPNATARQLGNVSASPIEDNGACGDVAVALAEATDCSQDEDVIIVDGEQTFEKFSRSEKKPLRKNRIRKSNLISASENGYATQAGDSDFSERSDDVVLGSPVGDGYCSEEERPPPGYIDAEDFDRQPNSDNRSLTCKIKRIDDKMSSEGQPVTYDDTRDLVETESTEHRPPLKVQLKRVHNPSLPLTRDKTAVTVEEDNVNIAPQVKLIKSGHQPFRIILRKTESSPDGVEKTVYNKHDSILNNTANCGVTASTTDPSGHSNCNRGSSDNCNGVNGTATMSSVLSETGGNSTSACTNGNYGSAAAVNLQIPGVANGVRDCCPAPGSGTGVKTGVDSGNDGVLPASTDVGVSASTNNSVQFDRQPARPPVFFRLPPKRSSKSAARGNADMALPSAAGAPTILHESDIIEGPAVIEVPIGGSGDEDDDDEGSQLPPPLPSGFPPGQPLLGAPTIISDTPPMMGNTPPAMVAAAGANGAIAAAPYFGGGYVSTSLPGVYQAIAPYPQTTAFFGGGAPALPPGYYLQPATVQFALGQQHAQPAELQQQVAQSQQPQQQLQQLQPQVNSALQPPAPLYFIGLSPPTAASHLQQQQQQQQLLLPATQPLQMLPMVQHIGPSLQQASTGSSGVVFLGSSSGPPADV